MKSTRMFEIIQLLRSANGPRTAQQIAESLEVTKRTIYRDIASLQARRVPIEGEAGIGYIIRPGYDLPPINFDLEEIEAISVGLSMLERTGDRGLQRGAARAAMKLSEASKLSETLFAAPWGPTELPEIDITDIRQSIRDERKLRLQYRDAEGAETTRIIWPVAMVYYVEVNILAAWCEMRSNFRHFRLDRIQSVAKLEDSFDGKSEELRCDWLSQQTTRFSNIGTKISNT